MKALSASYNDCAILIYDESGSQICTTTVTSHDKRTVRLEVKDMPTSLHVGDSCRLLILTEPAPCEYMGRIISEGANKIIGMYQGREKESRGAVRYKINTTAMVENLICDGRAYPLHTPLKVELVNISTSGVRFRGPSNAFSDGDRFQMRMKISDSEKLLIADAVHHVATDSETTEYGCRFLVASERVV